MKREQLYQSFNLIQFYRNHPVLAAFDLLNVDLAAPQRVIFRDLWFKQFVILVAGRGCGKTFLLSLLATLRALLYPATRIGYISATFRQSKLVFAETEKLYDMSSIFREACDKKPTKASDSCYVKFRPPKDGIGSWIEALPLGDGSKIRGSRFHILCLDEFPHIPSDIYDMVIRPMGATVMNPMENVRRIERMKRLQAMGIDTSSLGEGPVANKIIIASSGYFKFNHMWKRMKDYWRFRNQGNDKYAVHQIAYHEMPPGFLNEDQLEDAKRGMSNLQFTMEYGGLMVADSDGLFRASLLDSCSRSSLFSIELEGDPDREYIMGVDPARTSDAFAITVVELGSPNKLVFAQQVHQYSFQQATELVRRVFKRYNVVRIFMDSQGGGLMIRDLIQDPDSDGLAIIERDKSRMGLSGLPLLELVNPSTQNITDANMMTLALLENQDIWFPGPPIKSKNDDELARKEKAYEATEEMKRQMMNIRMSETRMGFLHFDTPSKGQRKDLYSAFILACYGINKLHREGLEFKDTGQLAGGVITPASEIPPFYHGENIWVTGGVLSESDRRIK